MTAAAPDRRRHQTGARPSASATRASPPRTAVLVRPHLDLMQSWSILPLSKLRALSSTGRDLR